MTDTLSRTELAGELALSPNRISELRKTGVLVSDDRGRYPRANIANYRAYLDQYLRNRYAQEKATLVEATTLLVRERAEQQALRFCDLRASLIAATIARDYLDYVRAAVSTAVEAMITDLVPKLVGAKQAAEAGLLISMQVHATLLICEHTADWEAFLVSFPQYELEEAHDELTWTDHDDAKESLDAARLAKVQYLQRYENLITGLMRGDYHRNEDFIRVVGSAFATVKSKLNGIPSKSASIIAGAGGAEGIESILRDNVAEALAELPTYHAAAMKPKEFIAQTPTQFTPAAEPEEIEPEESYEAETDSI